MNKELAVLDPLDENSGLFALNFIENYYEFITRNIDRSKLCLLKEGALSAEDRIECEKLVRQAMVLIDRVVQIEGNHAELSYHDKIDMMSILDMAHDLTAEFFACYKKRNRRWKAFLSMILSTVRRLR